MDAVDNNGYLENPSSLNAVLHRPVDDDPSSPLTQGVDGQAVRVDGFHTFIDIDTSALKIECFGDLNKCHMGKYLYYVPGS